ncbi:MAG: hypothetical protein IT204_01240 [Fimbriimonadaceae bacterium]|nr:hypothetical protein [Fimbriimonadaceae bacterium]
MSIASDRVFEPERIRRAGFWATLAGAATAVGAVVIGGALQATLAPLLGGVLSALVGLTVCGGLMWASWDWLALGWFNRAVRRDLIQRLRTLGELDFEVSDPDVYFVGLAHPGLPTDSPETDSDIGFLRLTPDELVYRGDRLHFAVPWAELAEVTVTALPGTLFGLGSRLHLRFTDDEPFAELYVSVREGDRLSRSAEVTRTLGEALTRRLARHRQRRLDDPLEAQFAEPLSRTTPPSA